MDIGNVASGSQDQGVIYNSSLYTPAEISQAQGIAEILLNNKHAPGKNLIAEISTSWEVDNKTSERLIDDWFRLLQRRRKDNIFAKKAFVESWVLEHLKTQHQTKS